MLRAPRILRERAGAEVPIIGVVMSPFSLPAMQLCFDRSIDLIYEDPESFTRRMSLNEEHCVPWANAQLEGGVSSADSGNLARER